jgi:phospholipase C
MRPKGTPKALANIRTIVLVMMENRSFDHLLGWMSHPDYGKRSDIEGLKGQIDPGSGELTEPSYRQEGRNQVWRPYIAGSDRPLHADLPHGRELVHLQMHKTPFAMNGFAEAQFRDNKDYPERLRPDSLMMLPPHLIPATALLAREFMVCDHWFSPIPTDTHPNRLMSLCGFTEIDQTAGEPIPLPDHYSVLDYCNDNNLRWRVYREALSFVTLFKGMGLEKGTQRFRGVSDLAHDFQKESAASFPQLIIVEPTYSDDPGSQTNTMHVPHPSWLIPTDNHPPNAMGPGEAFLAQVYRAVTSNERRWQTTVMVVVYDEHGGFFDHVPPFKVTTPAREGWKDKTPFTTSGPRVPAIIVSPLVPRASRTDLRFDHTSVLQLLADTAELGAYSDEIRSRFKEGAIHSVSEVIEEEPWVEKPPEMLPLKWDKSRSQYIVATNKPAAGTPAFEHARKSLAAQDQVASSGPKIKLGARNYLAARHSSGQGE